MIALVASLSLGQPSASASSEDLLALRSIGYVDTTITHTPRLRGVTLHEQPAYDGVNLVSSRHLASAHLVDMNGNILHTWRGVSQTPWMHVELLNDGSVIALAKDRYLVKLDAKSRPRWRIKTRVHHDFFIHGDGSIYALSRDARWQEFAGERLPVLADKVVHISADGKVIGEFDLLSLLAPLIKEEAIARLSWAQRKGGDFAQLTLPEYPGDLTHANSIVALHRSIPGVAKKGDMLLSVRELDAVVILDPHFTKVKWSWGQGHLEGQHHATQLPNGNILLFDNGVRRKKSRVIEVRPKTQRVVWEYTAKDLFTRLRGAAQRLPNGNILITESDSGHAIEVTRGGNRVWEFWNPDVQELEPGKAERAVIYRLLRYAPSSAYGQTPQRPSFRR